MLGIRSQSQEKSRALDLILCTSLVLFIIIYLAFKAAKFACGSSGDAGPAGLTHGLSLSYHPRHRHRRANPNLSTANSLEITWHPN